MSKCNIHKDLKASNKCPTQLYQGKLKTLINIDWNNILAYEFPSGNRVHLKLRTIIPISEQGNLNLSNNKIDNPWELGIILSTNTSSYITTEAQ